MAWGVDDVDAVVIPDTRGGRRSNGDTALLFLSHVVHGCGAVVNFTDLVALTGVVENAFCCRRLTGINVGHDADVASAI